MKAKILSISIGILLALFSVEAGLRIYGAFRENRTPAPAVRPKGSYTILCLGDSFTYGLGVSSDKAYPSQLAGLLGERRGAGKFTVINNGKLGQNTTQLVAQMPASLKMFNPDLVILLMGSSNEWDFRGYVTYLKGDTLFSRWCDQMQKIRIWRLAERFRNDLKTKHPAPESVFNGEIKGPTPALDKYVTAGMRCEKKGNFGEAAQEYLKSAKANPASPITYLRLAEVSRTMGDKRACEYYWFEAVKAHSTNPAAYSFAGDICRSRGEHDKAFAYYTAGIQLYPDDEFNPNFSALRFLYIFADQRIQNEIISFLTKLQRDTKTTNPQVSYIFGMSKLRMGRDERKDLRWVAHDVQRAIDLCTDAHVDLIMQNYPNHEKSNPVLREAAERNSVPFVDNESVFNEVIRRDGRAEYLLPDFHPTAKGYHIMVENLYKKIVPLPHRTARGNGGVPETAYRSIACLAVHQKTGDL